MNHGAPNGRPIRVTTGALSAASPRPLQRHHALSGADLETPGRFASSCTR